MPDAPGPRIRRRSSSLPRCCTASHPPAPRASWPSRSTTCRGIIRARARASSTRPAAGPTPCWRRCAPIACPTCRRQRRKAGAPALGRARRARRAVKQWVDAGHVLGNHGYSHRDANALTADAYLADVARGDAVTRELMRPHRPYTLFFRHPYTHTGDTLEKRDAITRGLAARGYTVMPHTIENADWLFNVAYVTGRRCGPGEAPGGLPLAHGRRDGVRRGQGRRAVRPRRRAADAAHPHLALNADALDRPADDARGSRLSLHNAG